MVIGDRRQMIGVIVQISPFEDTLENQGVNMIGQAFFYNKS